MQINEVILAGEIESISPRKAVLSCRGSKVNLYGKLDLSVGEHVIIQGEPGLRKGKLGIYVRKLMKLKNDPGRVKRRSPHAALNEGKH